MTKKQQVDLNNYRKIPRLLTEHMEIELGPGGCLHPVLLAVLADHRLRLDIRERRFNVYYGGGNLMCVDGRKSPWALSFDENYFKDGVLQKPDLPEQVSATSDAHARTWVEAFPHLIAGMDDWWKRHRQDERAHCQAIAGANSGMSSHPSGDYLVLDLEYQYAQRRFDMIAAKRRRTENDATGWQEPDLVFVEVKSALGACSGKSGLGDHARDYQDIITRRDRQHVKDIKQEYENVIAQKLRLGLQRHIVGIQALLSGGSGTACGFCRFRSERTWIASAVARYRSHSQNETQFQEDLSHACRDMSVTAVAGRREH